MKRDEYRSAADRHDRQASAFYTQWRKSCACRTLELRHENGHIVCVCGAILVPRVAA